MAKVYSAVAIICFSIIILFNFINCNHINDSVKFRNKRQITNVTTEYKNVPAATSTISSTISTAYSISSSSSSSSSSLSSSSSSSSLPPLLQKSPILKIKENENDKDIKKNLFETNISNSNNQIVTAIPPLSSTLSSHISTENSISIQSSSNPSILMKDKPLLGVNGTGQLKYNQSQLIIPSSQQQNGSQKPAIVSDPIEPPQKIPKISTPKKVISNPEPVSNSEILDTVDTPDDETRKELNKNNYTLQEDFHFYYNSSIVCDSEITKSYWETLKNITPNTMLSKSHRRAMTVQLSFEFPFYGHPVRNVTVATGGFLYTGEYVHSWLAATQYIAPLMANFDTSLSNDSFVKYVDNGTAFTVVWENVSLQDRQDAGTFTFSATLHKNGDIVFMYYSVPIVIEAIHDDKHPVKVGLSDAYIIDKVIFFARRKTIYEYHRVNFANQAIKNSTIIYLYAQPTCLSLTDCHSCLTEKINFNCTWCPTMNKCSTGTDRKRQDWLHKGCDKTQITDVNVCPALGEKGNNAAAQNGQSGQDYSNDSDLPGHGGSTGGGYRWIMPSQLDHNDTSIEHMTVQDKSVIRTYDQASLTSQPSSHNKQSSRVGLVLGLMLPLCFIMSALVWVLYAYRNPHTKSGQLLIQYRPSQWTWRRGEARYTAATIHM